MLAETMTSRLYKIILQDVYFQKI